ncbi:MAG TPA: hydratase [Verrucomicrobiae bacterium]|nr:hydratase [Verrucomicrobiae bacterium]
MVRIIDGGVYVLEGKTVLQVKENNALVDISGERRNLEHFGIDATPMDQARKQTMAYKILAAHNKADNQDNLQIRFDALASHDITYVGIIQTARASGLMEFPIPYVLTNCHNSLCAVGGTINEDDHVFGLSAAQKYGGIYVPAHQAVIHQYMREMMAGCGRMILGSDSHTRYGALGTMAIGEGGPELVKQLLHKTYDISYPDIIGVYLDGKPRHGVGPQDVALAIIGAVFKNGFVKNKVLEFVGPGIANLSVDYRNGIDVMTTETTCLSSIWVTDEKVRDYYRIHGRPEGYTKLEPGQVAYYDGMVMVDLDKIEPMIALPFHPSNVFSIAEVNRNPYDILKQVEEEGKQQLDNPAVRFSLVDKLVDGRLKVDQGIVAGCAGGTFENLMEVAAIVDKHSIGNGSLSLSAYPASQPLYLELIKNGAATKLISAGITMKTAFCGPCFGAGDVPANAQLSIRHTTRNFPNREGSKPGDGQISSVALMDARSIAATAVNGGFLTSAAEIDYTVPAYEYNYDGQVYANRVYNGFGDPKQAEELQFGPNIADWPEMIPLPENLLLKVATVIHDPVTTTDELIPSGETSSYRSNPYKLADFTLSRKDPQYVGRAKSVQALELERRGVATNPADGVEISVALSEVLEQVLGSGTLKTMSVGQLLASTGIGTTIYAVKPGDGSAREQAASCQKVLGGWANIAGEYATKRYRSNLVNWGLLPFTMEKSLEVPFSVDDYIFIPGIRQRLMNGEDVIPAQVLSPAPGSKPIELHLKNLTQDERAIILKGSLINYYTAK